MEDKAGKQNNLTLVSPQIEYFDNDHFVEMQNTGSNIKGNFLALKSYWPIASPKMLPPVQRGRY